METLLEIIPLLEPIRLDIAQVMHLLHRTMDGIEDPLGTRLHGVIGGGKCIRPALVILVGQLFLSSPGPFYTLAAAVEALHTATLIHDDLLDAAPVRRGRETLHTTWPLKMTVLAGDVLLAHATSLVADLASPRILRLFAETLCTMSTGEIRQLSAVVEEQAGREAYYRRIEAKTAALCAAATEMAAILAEASDPQVDTLRQFGWELGIAFQIVDDTLDLIGDERELGKPAGSDLRQGIITLPIICYLERNEDETVVSTVLTGQRDTEDIQAAIEAVHTSGAIEAALVEARAHARQAQRALENLPDNAARQMLHALAEYAVERRR